MNCNAPFPTLSEVATKEILGDNLAFVVAFGIDGEKKILFPNGLQITPEHCQGVDPLDLINIGFNISNEDNCLLSADDDIGYRPPDAQNFLMALKCCRKGGRLVTCPPNPLPCSF